MISDPSLPQRPRQVYRGLVGWWKRIVWRRATRRMNEGQINDLRKRLIIINRQLEELPVTSRAFKLRMELLRDRERCQTVIAMWEAEKGP